MKTNDFSSLTFASPFCASMALSSTGTGSEMSVTHLYALKKAFSAALLRLERLSTFEKQGLNHLAFQS